MNWFMLYYNAKFYNNMNWFMLYYNAKLYSSQPNNVEQCNTNSLFCNHLMLINFDNLLKRAAVHLYRVHVYFI